MNGLRLEAIRQTAGERFRLAEDKQTAAKKHIEIDIRTVASGIAQQILPVIEAKPFPEAFTDNGAELEALDITQYKKLSIVCIPMMGEAVLRITTGDKEKLLFEKQYARSVVQVILKALMLGRRKFSFPVTDGEASAALVGLSEWLPKVWAQIDEGFRMSAVGTKFELPVYKEVLSQLSVHELLRQEEVFGEVSVATKP